MTWIRGTAPQGVRHIPSDRQQLTTCPIRFQPAPHPPLPPPPSPLPSHFLPPPHFLPPLTFCDPINTKPHISFFISNRFHLLIY
ncbi:hypothetical protein ACFX2B_014458 [Malus domestica]